MADVPFLAKEKVSIVSVGVGEADSLRSVLEDFNYRVDVIKVGSRKEFLKILSGEIQTYDHLVLSVHGVQEGIYMLDEDPVGVEDIKSTADLSGKIVLNLGCDMGQDQYVEAFRHSGVTYYIAPTDYPEGNTALLFGIHLFYEYAKTRDIERTTDKARSFDEESQMFQLFKKNQ
jgi:hypothetical protein